MNQKTYLIDEDEHLENLRKIIKRDFFPNNRVSQNQSDLGEPLMSLDKYLAKHKSLENQIFSQLVKSDYEEWKKKNQWMEKCSKLMIEADKTKPNEYTNMIGKNQKLKAIDHSRIQEDPQNAIFFNHPKQTRSYQNKQHHQSKKIVYQNCSIKTPNIHEQVKYTSKISRNYQLEEIPQTSMLEGQKNIKNQLKSSDFYEKQYSIRREPSPEPEVAPIMTWGQIQSTPQRIQQYSIPQTPKRDLLLQEMNSKIYKQKKIKKQKKDEIKMRILSSMRPNMSSYRKASAQRIQSTKRQMKLQLGGKLDNLLN